MDRPEAGRRITSASDGCPGTMLRVHPVRPQVAVRWDDGTTSQEPTGEDRGWEYAVGYGHVCGDGCVCPEHGDTLWYHAPTDTHACQRVDCRYASELEAELVRQHEEARACRPLPPGWEGGHPPRNVPGA